MNSGNYTKKYAWSFSILKTTKKTRSLPVSGDAEIPSACLPISLSLLLDKYPPVDDTPAEYQLGKVAGGHVLPLTED